MEKIRLQKFLSNAGVCSRRKAEEYILEGKVKVNGKIVHEANSRDDCKISSIDYDTPVKYVTYLH